MVVKLGFTEVPNSRSDFKVPLSLTHLKISSKPRPFTNMSTKIDFVRYLLLLRQRRGNIKKRYPEGLSWEYIFVNMAPRVWGEGTLLITIELTITSNLLLPSNLM